MKLRQLKLDNQVSKLGVFLLFCNKWAAILTMMLRVLTLKSWQGHGKKTGEEKALMLLSSVWR